ncbi:MAG: acyl-CoA thioesterase [Candidatus Omnitrophica bacterium]|nr:acyl-CoA thioesterase [Candidatus Omnitrophota bacterium]
MKSHKIDLRVRYEETDQMGVVYYSNYLVWFEIARTELLRSVSLPYAELEKEGIYLVVAGASCQYKSPLKYDDLITIETRIGCVGKTSMAFDYIVLKKGKVAAEGKTSHVFTNRSFKPCRIPEKVTEAISDYLTVK